MYRLILTDERIYGYAIINMEDGSCVDKFTNYKDAEKTLRELLGGVK